MTVGAETKDDIAHWLQGRYLCATEAASRLLGYNTYERVPHVHTIEINFRMAKVGEEMSKGARVTYADGASIRAGTPAEEHALNTLSARCFEQIALPKPPPGAQIIISGFQGDRTPDNPFQHISWCCQELAVGKNEAVAKRTVEYLAKQTVAIVEQCFMNVDLKVSATGDKAAFTATSALQGQLVRIERQGTKAAGGVWSRASMVNLVLSIDKDVYPVATKILMRVVNK